jgi:hypothetical protein
VKGFKKQRGVDGSATDRVRFVPRSIVSAHAALKKVSTMRKVPLSKVAYRVAPAPIQEPLNVCSKLVPAGWKRSNLPQKVHRVFDCINRKVRQFMIQK